MKFSVEKKLHDKLGRVGMISTVHGDIHTPAFIPVGTSATVKSVPPNFLESLGAEALLSNTYHLHLQPGEDLVEKAGGLGKFMGWSGPTFTDSGGFQAYSLGAAMGKSVSKIALKEDLDKEDETETDIIEKLAKIDDEGITFKSHRDGSIHRFTPESVIEIQEKIGADIIFQIDEPTSPNDPIERQREALKRTYTWAKRCLNAHTKKDQALFGIVQGGRFENLRKESAKTISAMNFDGFGIGGSYVKEDIGTAVKWVNEILPEDKPRHLLGIGEPEDLFLGIENGCDTFDCVAPTRIGRHGRVYTKGGKVTLSNSKFRSKFSPIEEDCSCYACKNFTSAYVHHLFKSGELLGGTLASVHNIHFIVNLTKDIRKSILEDNFDKFKNDFLAKYENGK